MKKLTADHVYSLILDLSHEERQLLGKKIGKEDVLLTWEVVQASQWGAMLEEHGRLSREFVEVLRIRINSVTELEEKLRHHRKPARNAERDAEIMRLNAAGKTAGEIVNALRGQYELTDKIVNAAISRQRKKPQKK